MDSTQVGHVLDAIASRFSVPAAALWQAMIRQLYVDAAVDIVFLAFGTVALVLSIRWLQRAYAARESKYDDPFVQILATGASAVLFIIFLFATVFDVSYLFNPQYGALRQVLHLLSR